MARTTNDSGKKCSVLLVDEHPLIRECLASKINRQEDLSVCGEADEIKAALDAIEKLRPDVALTEIQLPGGSGFSLIHAARQRSPSTKVLVVTTCSEDVYGERVIRAGACGFVSKTRPSDYILSAIRSAREGKLVVSDELQNALLSEIVSGTDTKPGIAGLSDREFEIYRMMGSGMNSHEIAVALGLAANTVQVYYARIRRHLKLANFTELLRESVLCWQSAGGTSRAAGLRMR